jgi:hypothetical protein
MKKNNFHRIFYFVGLFLVLSSISPGISQGLSTEGKDFWVGYITNWLQSSGNPVILELYISADDTTRGVVNMPMQASFVPVEFEVYPNTTKKIQIPTSIAMATGSGVI